ncbi:MAG: hypothetical protein QMD03_03185 [Syntrophales bacterium]|nr:hypothetical protein [Syntrophales bacterium]
MKRFLVFFVAVSFLFCASAFAVEKPGAAPAKAAPAAKETKMSATGKVMEISDTMLKIERTVKGKAEIMEIVLEKACPCLKVCPKIQVGDKVKVSYVTKDDKNVALKVIKKRAKKVKKEGAAKEEKPAEE